jgi:hypothetical protein
VQEVDALPLWKWVTESYRDSVAFDGGRALRAVPAAERRVDTWYDDSGYRLSAAGSSLRLRRRAEGVRPSGPVEARLQFDHAAPAGTDDPGADASWPVDPKLAARFAGLPLLSLVAADDRADFVRRLQAAGLDPAALDPVLTIEQVRHGIRFEDTRQAAVGTLAMVECTCTQHDCRLRWFELQWEPATTGSGASLASGSVLAALRARAPELSPAAGSMPDWALGELEMASWLPLRTLRALRLSDQEFKALLLLVAAAAVGAATVLLAQRRRRLAASSG